MARGYLNLPEVTAEKFIHDPFAGEPGARMYKSGDLARWCADGTIECLGRRDGQIKLRGFRIELGEIESVMRELAFVRQAAVRVHRPSAEQAVLLGYATVHEASAPADAVAQIKEHCRRRLASYMVPSAVMVLERLPLNANGKLDERALPVPSAAELAAGAGRSRAMVAPRSGTEKALHDLWCELLRADQVSVEDDFFELGGHSLLAMQVALRAPSVLAGAPNGGGVTVKAIFELRTVARLAELADTSSSGGDGSCSGPGCGQQQQAQRAIEALTVANRRDGFSCAASFAQERLWLVQQRDVQSAAYNVPSFYRLRGEAASRSRLQRCLSALVERHEVLRTTYRAAGASSGGVGGSGLQQVVHSFDSAVCQSWCRLEEVELGGSPGLGGGGESAAGADGRLEEAMRREASTPFDLESGPVFRFRLWRLSAGESVLSINVHHIATDGMSQQLLLQASCGCNLVLHR